jgi:EpsI family protein
MVLIAASVLAYAMTPIPVVDLRDVDLENQVPSSFGQWRQVRVPLLQADLAPRDAAGNSEADRFYPYDQTVMRTYTGPGGNVVMLALAWGSKQRQEIKVHRPELCYMGQGFHVAEQRLDPVVVGKDKVLMTTRLLTTNQSRTEPVTYWIRIGDKISLSAWQSRVEILKEGLHRRITDGILVRISQVIPDSGSAEASYKVQDQFIRALLSSTDAKTRRVLVGEL